MEIRKKLGSKKTEKSFEISVFLVFSLPDRFWPLDMAGAGGFEPATHGFGDRYSTSWAIPLCNASIIAHIRQKSKGFPEKSENFFVVLQ